MSKVLKARCKTPARKGSFALRINMSNFEMGRENTTIILHYEKHEYDHLIHRREEAGMVVARYMFRHIVPDFDRVVEKLQELRCTFMVVEDPMSNTLEKYDEAIRQEMEKVTSPPEDWQ